MVHLGTSDIIGIAVGVPSVLIACLSLIVGFCTWKRPRSSVGQFGNAVARQAVKIRGKSIRGGDSREGPGADAQGEKIDFEGNPDDLDIETAEVVGGSSSAPNARSGTARGAMISIKMPSRGT